MRYALVIKDKVDVSIYRDFLSVLGLSSVKNYKGEVTVNDNGRSLEIVAESVMTLKDFLGSELNENKREKGNKKENAKAMDYDEVELLILHMGLQLLVLNNYKKGVFFLNLNDIIVIDHAFFLLGSLDHVLDQYKSDQYKLDQQEQLILSYPLKIGKADEQFLAPEVKSEKIKELPFIMSNTVGYYSLAKICMYCLFPYDNDNKQLSPLTGSKMYFFLERCLKTDPTERYFLYF